MRTTLTPKDVFVHKVGRFIKLRNGTRPEALKPRNNELVMELEPEQSREIDVEFYGKSVIGDCNY